MFDTKFMSTVWSAAPTPFTADGKLDRDAIFKLADHHAKLGVKGVFIAGTCGEGAYLSDSVTMELARLTVEAAAGRMAVAMQITDNSVPRLLDNLKRGTDAGIDMAVIAPPNVAINYDQDYLYNLYSSVAKASPIAMGIYHRGSAAPIDMKAETIAKLAEIENIVTLKDSACKEHDTAVLLGARDALRSSKQFFAYCGNEFDCVGAAIAGYDGMTIGGGCFNGRMAKDIFELAQAGKVEEAKALQERMNTLMFDIFGGKNITCWLAGQKQLMVEMGIFSSNYCLCNYHLDKSYLPTIQAALEREKEYLV